MKSTRSSRTDDPLFCGRILCAHVAPSSATTTARVRRTYRRRVTAACLWRSRQTWLHHLNRPAPTQLFITFRIPWSESPRREDREMSDVLTPDHLVSTAEDVRKQHIN